MDMTNTETYYVSQEGLADLHKRLANLEGDSEKLRLQLIELRQIKDAEEFDLVAETVQLAFLEKEIARVKHIIAHCKVRPMADGADGTVKLGSIVRLRAKLGKEIRCMLVSALEANPEEGKVSDKSPLGRALLGKVANAWIKVNGPRKSFEYRIVGIERMAT